MGLKCALIRTLILGLVILHFTNLTTNFWYMGFSVVMPYMIIIFVSFIIIVYTWICAFLGGPFRAIRQYCNQSENPKEAWQRLESAWSDNFATQNCLISNEYFIWAKKLHAEVIPLNEIYGIKYVEGFYIGPGDLWIYLNDNTAKRLRINETQGRQIEEHIRKNVNGIFVGDAAASRLLRTVIGKVNYRYQIIKIRERFFILDYSNPGKLSSFLSWGEKYRFGGHGTKRSWRAWEISRDELLHIKSTAYTMSGVSPGIIGGLTIGGGILIAFFLNRHDFSETLSIQSLVGGQFWIVAMILAGLFLICFFFTLKSSKFETKKYTEVRIPRKPAQYTKGQLFWYLVARLSFLAVLLFFIVVLFFSNVGLISYAILTFVLIVYIFMGIWTGNPSIDPRSNIGVLYKKIKSKEKRRVVQWKRSCR